jgi:hypothetical protein
MILFLALCFVAAAIAAFSAMMIFWPLTLVHIRDRHADIAAQLGPGAFFSPDALRWLLNGRYKETRDPSLIGLAMPARAALLAIFIALTLAGLLWLWSLLFA